MQKAQINNLDPKSYSLWVISSDQLKFYNFLTVDCLKHNISLQPVQIHSDSVPVRFFLTMNIIFKYNFHRITVEFVKNVLNEFMRCLPCERNNGANASFSFALVRSPINYFFNQVI